MSSFLKRPLRNAVVSVLERPFAFAATPLVTGGFFADLSSLPATYPFWFGNCFTSGKTAFADASVQLTVERREHLDLARLATFSTFGFVWMGAFQYMLFVKFFQGYLFPSAAAFAAKPLLQKARDPRGCFNVLMQVAIDQGIHMPFLFLPVFYSLKEALQGDAAEQEAHGSSIFRTAISKWRNNFAQDCLACWTIWVPAQLINFSFMPSHLRVPFVAMCSLAYTAVLSITRGNME